MGELVKEEIDLGTQWRVGGHMGRKVGFEITVPESVAFMCCEPLTLALCQLFHLILMTTVQQGPLVCVFQMGKQAQRGEVTCLRPHSQSVAELGLDLRCVRPHQLPLPLPSPV